MFAIYSTCKLWYVPYCDRVNCVVVLELCSEVGVLAHVVAVISSEVGVLAHVVAEEAACPVWRDVYDRSIIATEVARE